MAFIKINKDTFGEMRNLGLADEYYVMDKKGNKYHARDFNVANKRSSKSKTYFIEEDIYKKYAEAIGKYIVVRKQIFKELLELKYIKFNDSNYIRVNKKIYVKKTIYNEYAKYL